METVDEIKPNVESIPLSKLGSHNITVSQMEADDDSYQGEHISADGDVKPPLVTGTRTAVARKRPVGMDGYDRLPQAPKNTKVHMSIQLPISLSDDTDQQDPSDVSHFAGPSSPDSQQPCVVFHEDHCESPEDREHPFHSQRNTHTTGTASSQQVSQEDVFTECQLDLECEDVAGNEQALQGKKPVEHPLDLDWLLNKDTMEYGQGHVEEMKPDICLPQMSDTSSAQVTENASASSIGLSIPKPYTLVTSANTLTSLVQSYAHSCSALPHMLYTVPVSSSGTSSLSMLCTPVDIDATSSLAQSKMSLSQAGVEIGEAFSVSQASMGTDGTPRTLQSSMNNNDTVSMAQPANGMTQSSDGTSVPEVYVGSISSFPVLSEVLAKRFAALLSSLPPVNTVTDVGPSSMPRTSVSTEGTFSSLPQSLDNSSCGVPFLRQLLVNSNSPVSCLPHIKTDHGTGTTAVSSVSVGAIARLASQTGINSCALSSSTPAVSVSDATSSPISAPTASADTSASLPAVSNITSASVPVTSVNIATSASTPLISVNTPSTFHPHVAVANSSVCPQLIVYNVTPLLVLPDRLFSNMFMSPTSQPHMSVVNSGRSSSLADNVATISPPGSSVRTAVSSSRKQGKTVTAAAASAQAQISVGADDTSSPLTSTLVKTSALGSSTERPYACHYCSAGFVQPNSLALHIKSCKQAPKDSDPHEAVLPPTEAALDSTIGQPLSPSEPDGDGSEDEADKGAVVNQAGHFVCDKCNQTFDTNRALRKHMQNHMERPHRCTVCGKSFAGTWYLRKHELSHTKGKKHFKCEQCPKSFALAKVLDKHMQSHAGDRPFACDVCEETFYSSSLLTKHKRQHTNPKLMCSICNKAFDFATDLRSHKRTHISRGSARKSILCDFCGKNFASVLSLRKHVCKEMKSQSGQSFSCDTCDKTFTSAMAVQVHERVMHMDSVQSLDSGNAITSKHKLSKKTVRSDPKRYVCHVCGKVLKTFSTLQVHELVHSDQKRFVCEICNKGFNFSCYLKKHQHVHTGIKDFTCEVCQKTFSSRHSLKLHYKNMHIGDRPFVCDVCGQGLITKHALKLHKLKHSDEKPFICDVCNRAFRYECVLKNHKLLHLDDKPFKCDMCDKAYVCFSYLAKHKRVHAEPKYICDVCGKSCFFANELKNHKLTHSEHKPYACDLCNKAFPSVVRLNNHKLIHSNDKSFACTMCDKAFPSWGFLNRHHKQSHLGAENAFVCDVCKRTFTRHETLKNHMNIHLNAKTFVCNECGKGFHSASALRTHAKLKHTDSKKAFVCKMCGKAFPFQSYLREHEKVHSSEKSLVCKLCNKAVKYKLWRHMKQVHNIDRTDDAQ